MENKIRFYFFEMQKFWTIISVITRKFFSSYLPGDLRLTWTCLLLPCKEKKKKESLIHLLTLLLKTLGAYESPGEVFKNTLCWAPSSKILIQQVWSGPRLYGSPSSQVMLMFWALWEVLQWWFFFVNLPQLQPSQSIRNTQITLNI